MKTNKQDDPMSFLDKHLDFPNCPKCGDNKEVGTNPLKTDADLKTKYFPDWHCYKCNISFQPI